VDQKWFPTYSPEFYRLMLTKMSGYSLRCTLLLITAVVLLPGCNNHNSGFDDEKARSFNNSAKPHFDIEITDTCTILNIYNPWQGAQSVHQKYFLVKKEMKEIDIPDSSDVIIVPVEKIVCTSTTHLAMIKALGHEESVIGFSGTQYIYDPYMISRVKDASIRDIGYDSGLNYELILKMSPDLFMAYGIGGESIGHYQRLRQAGINVLINADYLEEDPLVKTEWLRVFGALYSEEEKADSIILSVRQLYNEIKKSVSDRNNKPPDVLCGLPYKDTWYISPGNSFLSRLIKDAGGNYLWNDTYSDISMPLSIENVFVKAAGADYWINPGIMSTLGQIKDFDRRLSKIGAFKKGNIYNNNRRMSVNGGNDYWESGVLNPHLILQDIAAILDPSSYSRHTLYYFKKLE